MNFLLSNLYTVPFHIWAHINTWMVKYFSLWSCGRCVNNIWICKCILNELLEIFANFWFNFFKFVWKVMFDSEFILDPSTTNILVKIFTRVYGWVYWWCYNYWGIFTLICLALSWNENKVNTVRSSFSCIALASHYLYNK